MIQFRVHRRQELPIWHSCLIFSGAVLLSLGISAVMLAFQGKPALGGIVHLFQGAFGTVWAIEDCLVKAVPLFLCSLGVAVAFRLQIWNIGAEGQFALGAIGATWFALTFENQDPLVYCSYLTVPALWLFFRNTKWGLRLRSVGEYPAAAFAAGLPVHLYRWAGVTGGGFLVGLGGAYLSLAYTHLWTSGMSAGRGWIAVALVIFAFWRPERALIGAYLFGGIMAFQLRLQAMGTHIPSSLLLMLPYGLTVLVLVISSRKGTRAQAPAALGVNIEPAE